MRPSTRRLAVASVLTAAAVIVPCTAWYVAGSRDVLREGQRLERQATDRARQTANLLSMRAATMLENLREAEAGCSYLHYQHVTYGESVECDCPSLDPAGGPETETAELVLARYQFEGDGSVYHAMSCLAGAIEDTGVFGDGLGRLAGALTLSLDEAPYLDEVLEEDLSAAPRRDEPVLYHGESLLTQGPFVWRTVALEGVPTLAAIRRVLTDSRTLAQGFLVSGAALEERLEPLETTAVLVHGPAEQPGEADLPIPGTSWRVVIDAQPALEEARREAGAIRSRFRNTFLAGAAIAALAGLCLLGLIWQGDRLSRLRARFAAAAAHELRSPLATIRLHSEMLAENLGKPELARQYAGRVGDEVERLGRVVTNTLGYARLEEGRLEVQSETGDLGACVLEAVESLRPGIELAGARIECHIGEDLPAARFDPEAVHHIVRNLVDNAEKFSRSADDRTIRIDLGADGGMQVLTVADHGPGVPSTARRRLFRPFALPAGNGANEGLGLGLVLVRALTVAMGGDVAYADVPGGGACFTVRLPAEESLILDTPD